jgi:hypothetical protein
VLAVVALPLESLLSFIALFSLGHLLLMPGWVFLASAVCAFGAQAGGLATYAAACVSCVFALGVIPRLVGDVLRQLKSPLALKLLWRLDAATGRCGWAHAEGSASPLTRSPLWSSVTNHRHRRNDVVGQKTLGDSIPATKQSPGRVQHGHNRRIRAHAGACR